MDDKIKKELLKYRKLFDNYIKLYMDEKIYDKYIDEPKRYDDLYMRLESTPDYEYTYVLAYELSQKNEKVKKHFKKAEYYRENVEEYKKNILDFYQDTINLGYSKFLEENIDKPKYNSFFEISDTNLTLNDVQRFDIDFDVEDIGFWKLIAYLIDTKNIYKRTNYTFEDSPNNLTYEYCELIDIDEADERIHDIMTHPDKYAAYCKSKYTDNKKLTALSKDMPLEILDEDFLKDLTMIRLKDKNSYATINYSVPTLKFKDQTVINFPINLNLDVAELKSYIEKIKNDFDNTKSITQSPLEIFGEKLQKAQKPNSEKILPNKTTNDGLLSQKWKKALADAVYIYDLYKYIEKLCEEENIQYDQDYILLDVSFASGISKVHNKILEEGSFDDEFKKNDRFDKYYKLMREYIEEERFQELITGVTINKVPGMYDTN